MGRAPTARLRPPPDEVMIRLVRALARQAAREDHERGGRPALNNEGQICAANCDCDALSNPDDQ
jgi:hypothetical protein